MQWVRVLRLPYATQHVFDALVAGTQARCIAAVAALTVEELVPLPASTYATGRTVKDVPAGLVVEELAYAAPVAGHGLRAVDARLGDGL